LADIQVIEFPGFQDYLKKRRPTLEDAFERELSGLLDGIPLRDAPSLRTTLAAGKKIRGCLSCLISDVLGGDFEAPIPRAVAVEMVQAATLIHDDFVDQDTVRGSLPAVWTIEGPRRAVLIGDVLFASAIEMMSRLGREDGLVISRAIAQVAQGALREPLDPVALAEEIESDRLPDNLFEKIIHLKTAILFGTACHLGAIAAGADMKIREAAYRYGIKIGEAYQIADDLKEVKLHLSKRSIDPKQMVALTPAFLHFTHEIRPCLPDILGGRSSGLFGPVLEFFAVAAGLMEEEIELRLQGAVKEAEKSFPDNDHTDLVRKSPRDILRMFNQS
jgi:hypothetical protein